MEEKIIMYDSPEAAEPLTMEGWISKGTDGRFFYKSEHDARWRGCTHMRCDCGGIMKKAWTKCDTCRAKSERERFLKLPYKEWDGVEYVYSPMADKYFWSIDDLNDYMYDEEIDEINLLICDPVLYDKIDCETVAGDAHEDWEPEKELEQKINEFNAFLSTLKPHSWTPGKVRTSYVLPIEDRNPERSVASDDDSSNGDDKIIQ